jgi:erythromycin esterase-like protein
VDDQAAGRTLPTPTLPQLIAQAAEPLPSLNDPAFGRQVADRFAGRRMVLLGEASHGSTEFYRARPAPSRPTAEPPMRRRYA